MNPMFLSISSRLQGGTAALAPGDLQWTGGRVPRRERSALAHHHGFIGADVQAGTGWGGDEG